MKSWLQDNDVETYSTHNEGKSVVAERFIRALKNKIYKCMTSISKNVYIDKLDEIINKYSNIYHSTIKMKPADVNSSALLILIKEIIENILNLKLLIMQEYQNTNTFLQKVTLQIGLKKFCDKNS